MAANLDLTLGKRQLFTRRHHDLRLHDVHTRDEFGDRVFHLHPRVHLDEIKLAVFVQELEGSSAAITNLLAGRHTPLTNAFDRLARNTGRWRFLNHFLMTPLH